MCKQSHNHETTRLDEASIITRGYRFLGSEFRFSHLHTQIGTVLGQGGDVSSSPLISLPLAADLIQKNMITERTNCICSSTYDRSSHGNVDLTMKFCQAMAKMCVQRIPISPRVCNVQSCFAKQILWLLEITVCVSREMNALCNFNYTPKRH